MDNTQRQALTRRISSLESAVSAMQPEIEGVLAHRVYKDALSRLYAYGGLLAAFAAVLLSVIGYGSYSQVVEKGTAAATARVSEVVLPKIEEHAREVARGQLEVRLAELMVNARAEASARIDQELAALGALHQRRVDALVEELRKQYQIQISVTALAKVQGYALYGEGGRDDQGRWAWRNRNFDLVATALDAFPEKGSRAETVKAVAVRTELPFTQSVLLDFKIKPSASVDKRWPIAALPSWGEAGDNLVGILPPKRRVAIQEIQILLDRFVWVRLEAA